MEGTFWAFVPAIIAIVLALLTKQVYVSLFLGIFVGAMMYAGGDPLKALFTLYQVMSEKVGGNTPIIVFLVVLGILVVLLQKSGGAKAYGDWAGKKIKSKGGALAATAGLGCLIFVDDYFNCLTVGSVMRPVTDKFKIARSKLAYIIDATAAPVCIIAPISSWAAAVAGELEGDGLMVFISTIPFNVYALLTLVMVFALCFFKFDFGKMKRNDLLAEQTGDVHAGVTEDAESGEEVKANPNGKVRHLLIPVLVLIACCIGGMIYTGFFYNWDTGLIDTVPQSANVIEAFSNCDAGLSLAIGSTVALFIIAAYYMITRVVSFKEITGSFTEGFKAMVPAILILTFAWSISGIMGARGGYLDAQAFVQNNLAGSAFPQFLFPAIFFILAGAIAFATGTSWGTFGVLVPIAVTILGGSGTLTILTVSATLGGAVFGDHISPISDTTILASAGAQCNHVEHVNTQLPYAALVASIAAVAYVIAGLCASLGGVLCCLIMWAAALALFVGCVLFIKAMAKKKASA
ncbi:MAG: Na+/H+ antiporter NhaC family protein [Ruminococcaceae bacterium]|nr:Na+/H+ antiporter NhaC family protein [Oscillospiraceae bacterium]